MSIKEITDRYGRTFAWDEHDGTGQFQELTDGFLKMEMKDKLHEVKLYEMRNDDIIICAYPKAGLSLFIIPYYSLGNLKLKTVKWEA